MKNLLIGSQAALSIVQGCLVASIQADLYDDLLVRIRNGILDRVHSKTVKGVVFDMSAVRVMDTYIFNYLADTARMTKLLGVEAFFTGFRPGVVSALVDLDVDVSAILSFRSMDDAIGYLVARSATQEAEDVCEEEICEDDDVLNQGEDDDGSYEKEA